MIDFRMNDEQAMVYSDKAYYCDQHHRPDEYDNVRSDLEVIEMNVYR